MEEVTHHRRSGSSGNSLLMQEINFVEQRPDGSLKEGKIKPPRENSVRHLTIEHLQSKKLDPNSENWRTLSKGTQDFYLNQNQEIDGFHEVEQLLGSAEAPTSQAAKRKAETFVVNLSFAVNIVLVISLVLAVVFSGAIAIIASVIDSSLDIFSAVITVITNRAKNKVDYYKYPQGKERLEPVGVLIFSAVMGTSSLLLIIEAVKRLADNPLSKPELSFISIGFVVADIVIKLILFIVCTRMKRDSHIAKALAQDHRNDVVVNSVALVTAFLGSYYWGPIDPIGAILISFWTMFNWGGNCLEQVKYLTGRSASPEFLKTLTWVCYNHDPEVIGIDTVRAFHFGLRFLVEIDIVLPPDMTLKEAHDIGEALQKKVELLDDVERAFVHLDFETSHNPNTEHKRWGDF